MKKPALHHLQCGPRFYITSTLVRTITPRTTLAYARFKIKANLFR